MACNLVEWSCFGKVYLKENVIIIITTTAIDSHSVAVVLTLVQTKQIRINIPKRNSTKSTVQTIQNTVGSSKPITKPPQITKPTHTNTHSLQNKLKQQQYKLKQLQYTLNNHNTGYTQMK